MKTQILTNAALLSLAITVQASSDTPLMQLHIFEDDENSLDSASTPAMHMVIFADEENTMYSTEHPDKQLASNQTNAEQAPVFQESVEIETAQDSHNQAIKLQFYFDTGYRQDKLNWTIADQDGSPNILSELSWDNIEIVTFGLGNTLRTPSNFVFNADFVYGQIIDGNNQDSDFAGDNRTREFSRSNNNADEGNVIDFSISAGYQLDLGRLQNQPVLSLIPNIGFSYHTQNFKIRNGTQTIPATGNFSAILDSSYDASWYGPWAGLSSQLNFGQYFSLFGNFEYHYAFYEATADWNLRQDFAHPQSFTHEAEGTGYNASLGSTIKLDEDLALNLSVDYKKWDADKKGIDTTFGSGGNAIETGFNGVNWESMGANIGLQYRF